MKKLLNLVKYDELIDFLGTMNFMNYDELVFWGTMNFMNYDELDFLGTMNFINYDELYFLGTMNFINYDELDFLGTMNFINYDEVIAFLGTMSFRNYELWTAMNSNCDKVNCCEGSKVLWLYYIMLLCFIMCALHEHVTTIKRYKRLHSFVECEEMPDQFVVQCCGRL